MSKLLEELRLDWKMSVAWERVRFAVVISLEIGFGIASWIFMGIARSVYSIMCLLCVGMLARIPLAPKARKDN